MTDKKIQVFVSSTYKDLINERNEIVFGILKSGHIPVGMELFSAVGTQQEVIKRTIGESDAYCLIIGSRYGTINSDTGISYTEWEYRYAREKNKPTFVLILGEDYLQKRVDDGTLDIHDIQINDTNYTRFKEEVMKDQLVAIIKHLSGIKGEVQSCLQTIVKEYGDNLIGWVSGSLVNMKEQKDEQYTSLLRELSGRNVRIKNLEQENAQIKAKGYVEQQDFTNYVKELTKSKDGNDQTKEAILFLRNILSEIVRDNKNKVSDEFNLLKHNHDGDTYKMATIDLEDRSIIFKANYETNEITVILSDRKASIYKSIDKFILKQGAFISTTSKERLDTNKVYDYLEYLKGAK